MTLMAPSGTAAHEVSSNRSTRVSSESGLTARWPFLLNVRGSRGGVLVSQSVKTVLQEIRERQDAQAVIIASRDPVPINEA